MCDIFYITRLTVQYFYIAHLGVRYEIYPLSFSFDLRCQSGIYIYIYIYIYNYIILYIYTYKYIQDV